jgi:predicted metal-dependent hydrolase
MMVMMFLLPQWLNDDETRMREDKAASSLAIWHDEASRWVKLRSFTICSTVGTMAQWRPEVHPEVRKTWETWETWAADASSIGRDRNDPGIGAATSDRFFPGPGTPQKCRLF